MPYREIGKHEFLRGYELMRQAADDLGAALNLGEDIYFLTLPEFEQIDRVEKDVLIAVRRRERALWQTISLPPVIDERGIMPSHSCSEYADVEFSGQIVSAGSASGIAWFPQHGTCPEHPSGVVLVSPTLPPHFVGYFSAVNAVVVDQSALLSHGAILARQFGIPVISHPSATSTIRENDLVTVDGTIGRIRITRRSLTLCVR